MSDRELLELAANAAGISYDAEKSLPVEGRKWWGLWLSFVDEPGEFARRHWNPLTDDGDALRLAVKLRINIEHMADMGGRDFGINCWPRGRGDCGQSEDSDLSDYCAATRRAIVRAAAEIGRAMQ